MGHGHNLNTVMKISPDLDTTRAQLTTNRSVELPQSRPTTSYRTPLSIRPRASALIKLSLPRGASRTEFDKFAARRSTTSNQPRATGPAAVTAAAAAPAAGSGPAEEMAGGSQEQIPGLGHARANESLPKKNFSPDSILATFVPSTDDKKLTKEELRKFAEEAGYELSDTSTIDGDSVPGDNMPEETRELVAALDIADHPTGGANGVAQSTTNGEAGAQDQPMKDSVAGADNQPMDIDGDAGAQNQPTSNSEAGAQNQSMEIENGDAGTENQQADQDDQDGGDNPEWEVDSSPYESSSESSSDSDSDEDSEAGSGYPLLSLEETARILMQSDLHADDEIKGPAGAPRTKNEVEEEAPPIPDVTITPDMKIERLGEIQFVVENTLVIKSSQPGKEKVLDMGSVLCKEDRTVIGALADIIGNVESPMYTVLYKDESKIRELGVTPGMPVFYSVQHANYVFTQPLREVKGTDASNLHDEEVGPEEMEFSDDEKEAEYKRAQKMKKQAKQANKKADRTKSGFAKNDNAAAKGAGSMDALNYDDDDEPYKPLQRPQSFSQSGPDNSNYNYFASSGGGRGRGRRSQPYRDHDTVQGRGDFRNRGDFHGRNNHRDNGPQHGGRGRSSSGASQGPQAYGPPLPPGFVRENDVSYPPRGGRSYTPQAAQPQTPLPAPAVTGTISLNSTPIWNQNQGQQQYPYPQAPVPPYQQPTGYPQQQTGYTPQHAGYAQPYAQSPAQAHGWPAQAAPATGYGGYQQPAQQGYQQHAQQAQYPQQGQHQQQYWPQQHQAHGGYHQPPPRQ
ncbi:hypothetical protein VTJ49DRAFT_7163 [Mycothermus thermophilus]|uniref:H/ACA ribonucleoprotein complex non-core subunit NAF1 n=1 Tax=Humicola insolens TaxID=85995 RepID=A0ABR3VHW3_HUMIN